MLKNIVVTGGAGFIGSNLVHTLAERYPSASITVIDDFRSGHFSNLEGYRGDIIAEDVSRMDFNHYFGKSKVDAVFHLASITDTTEHNQRKQVFDNVEGWRNVLRFFSAKKARLMYASSAATYGIASGVNKLEQMPRPANVYGFSKVQLERLTQAFNKENPKQIAVGLRYFNVYGPREPHKGAAASMMYQLARQMVKGKAPRIFKYGEQKRDFVYVKDIVDYTIAAVTNAKKSGVYNAGSGQARTFNDVIAALNKVLKLKLKTQYFDNPYSFYQTHTEADLTQTIKGLGIKPKFTLEQGIADYHATGWLLREPPKQ